MVDKEKVLSGEKKEKGNLSVEMEIQKVGATFVFLTIMLVEERSYIRDEQERKQQNRQNRKVIFKIIELPNCVERGELCLGAGNETFCS